MVKVENLTRIYHTGSVRQVVFDALTFSVEKGETVALLGASGSGKTTLLNLISGIDTPDHGRVLIDGVDVHALVEPRRTLLRRRQIGFVFQFFNLIPTLKVGENIALPLELLGVDDRTAQQRAATLLEDVGLGGLAMRYPETLSGGEQQRAAIARALAHQPALLLADEPTGNLDSKTSQEIMALIDELHQQGQTIIMVTHEPDIAAHCERVIRLTDGLVESDLRQQTVAA